MRETKLQRILRHARSRGLSGKPAAAYVIEEIDEDPRLASAFSPGRAVAGLKAGKIGNTAMTELDESDIELLTLVFDIVIKRTDFIVMARERIAQWKAEGKAITDSRIKRMAMTLTKRLDLDPDLLPSVD